MHILIFSTLLKKLRFAVIPRDCWFLMVFLTAFGCVNALAQTNLALNKPVTSSSTLDATNNPNSNLTDGDYSTVASTNNTQTGTNAEWFKIDLGADYFIETIRIGSKPNSENGRRFLIVTQAAALPDKGINPNLYTGESQYNRLIYTNGTSVTANSNTQPFGVTSPGTVPQAAGTNLGPAFPNNKIELYVGVHKARYVLIMSLQDTYFDLAEIEVFAAPPAIRTFVNTGFETGATATGSGSMVREGLVPGWNTTEAVAMNFNDASIPTNGSFIEFWGTTNSINVPVYEGNHFVELNAFTAGKLSQQPICVLAGESFNFSFAHRGRNGVDEMDLSIDDIDVANFKDNNAQTGTHTATVLAGITNVTLNTPVTDANGWTLHSGTWTNTSGSSKIISFGFRAVSSAGGNISIGNFLDAVSVTSLSALVSFNNATASGLESISTAALPKLLVNGQVPSNAAIEINITGGTATRGADYTTTPSSGVISVPIPAGNYDGLDATAISLAPYIQIAKDAVMNEAPETIIMELQNPSASMKIANGTSCSTSNGTATYTIIDDVSISGNVFHDANGLVNNTVDGTGTNVGGLNAVLVNNNVVIGVVAVGSNGTFNFASVQVNLPYTVQITTNTATPGQAPPGIALPDGWVNTGENNATTAGSDGTVNGISASFTPVNNVDNINFGIEQLPTPDSKAYAVARSTFTKTPSGGSTVTGYVGIPASSNSLTGYTSGGSLTGSDPEDCTTAGSCNAGSTFVINTIKPNTRLFYNGTEILAGGVISNFDVTKLYIYGQNGSGTSGNPVGFTYSLQDAAAQNSAQPATYQITTDLPLPVTLVAFNASVSGELSVKLSWSTSQETNSDYFEVMYSRNARDWIAAGKVAANGNTNKDFSYQFTHVSPFAGIRYYRLKMVDRDGSYALSSIRKVVLNEPERRSVYPNPVTTDLHVDSAEGTVICIYDVVGRIRLKSKVSAGIVDVRNLTNGIYVIEITNPEGSKSTSRIVVTK